MYSNISYELAAAKHRDMLAQGEKERRASLARQLAATSQRSTSRRSARTWLTLRLRPQAQS